MGYPDDNFRAVFGGVFRWLACPWKRAGAAADIHPPHIANAADWVIEPLVTSRSRASELFSMQS
jgi:hypothetical protein